MSAKPRNTGGRPRLSDARRRDAAPLRIRLADAEREAIQDHCSELETPVSEWARNTLLAAVEEASAPPTAAHPSAVPLPGNVNVLLSVDLKVGQDGTTTLNGVSLSQPNA